MNTEIKKTYLRNIKIDHDHLFKNITTGVALHEMISDKKGNSVNYQFIEIIKLLSKAKNRSDFLDETCKYLVQNMDYYGAFILLQYNNGRAKDLFSSGDGSDANHIRNNIIKGVDLPCCNIAKKRNGLIAICDPLYTCKGCVVCCKDTLPAFSVVLKYLNKIYGILVVSVPEKYAFDQKEVNSFSELAADISFALHMFDHDNKDYLVQKRYMNFIEETTTQIAALIEKNEKLELINSQLIKEKEITEATDNCKTFFLENISYEIKNPLNGILGFSYLLQKSELPSTKLKEYGNLINFCGNQLLNTFNNFIDISRIEAGLIRLNNEEYFLNNLLTDLYSKFIKIIQCKKGERIKLIYRPYKFIDSIFIDKILLYKALEHILNNAVKYTYSGEIEFGYKPYGETSILFYVKDTGIGIPKEKWKVIFEKFRQVEESSRKNYSGTGLGLAIAKGYVEKMGGWTWLESKVTKGTTFYFTIPYVTHNNDK